MLLENIFDSDEISPVKELYNLESKLQIVKDRKNDIISHWTEINQKALDRNEVEFVTDGVELKGYTQIPNTRTWVKNDSPHLAELLKINVRYHKMAAQIKTIEERIKHFGARNHAS